MTKKQNTLVFILIGTIVNVVFSILLIIGFMIIGLTFLKQYATFVMPIAFIAGMLLGMFAYQKLAKFVIVHFHMEDKLDPLFTAKRFSRKRK